MSHVLIDNVRIVRPGERIAAGSLLIDGSRIARLDPSPEECPPDAARLDGGGRLLTPGLIDVHTHGIHRYQYESGPEHLLAAAKVLGAYGTTCVVPTIVPMPGPRLLPQLEQLAKTIPSVADAHIPGLHLEGPFVALTGAACRPIAGDVRLLDEMIAACGGRVTIMSLSPETPGVLPVIERLCERSIVPFITHTRATPEQTQAAIDAGARHATHFYDVYPVPPETEPGARPVGAVEAILADRRVSVDFIADGCHVHPVAIRAAAAAKGYAGIVLVTDSNIGAGLPPGEYDTPWGFRVRVRPGDGARNVRTNELAGSALTMNEGIANLLKWLGKGDAGSPARSGQEDLWQERAGCCFSADQVWAMGTSNAARLIGLNSRGRIEPGADADLVLWDDNLRPALTWVGGRCVYAAA